MMPPSMISSLLLVLTLSASIRASTEVVPPQQANNNFVLHLVHVNDHHSHLEERRFNIPPEALPQVENRARRVRYGGYPRLVRIFRQFKSTYKHVLKIHAGDALTGTGLYHLFGVNPDVEMMHQVCYDVFNIGNHEFDDGDAVLAEFVTKLTDVHSPCQNTRVLSSNLVPGSNSPLSPLQQQGYIAPFVIRNFRGGHRVGIIGVDIRNKTLTGSSPDPGTTLTDERHAIRQQIRILENRGINKIILVSHVGFARDNNWMTRIEGVDVVVGGHSHTLLAKSVHPLINAHGRYPHVTYQQASESRVCIVHGWKFGHGIGRLRVEFDADGKVVHCGGDYVIPFEPHPQATPQDAAIVTNYLHSLGPTFVHTTQEGVTRDKLQFYVNAMGGDYYVTDETDPLCHQAIPGQGGGSAICARQGAFTNHHGGPACNLVAQALLDQTQEADVAIQNAGGCRSDIVSGGNFSYHQAMEFLPFSDTLVTLQMAGHQIHRVLEQALDLAFDGESAGSYPYASGLRFDVNASQTVGFRVTNLQLNSRLQEGTWNDIDWNTTYKVVTNSFLAAGRDGYLEFTNAEGRQDTNVSYLDAFIQYVEEQGSIKRPDPENMSTQHFQGLALPFNKTEGTVTSEADSPLTTFDGIEDSNDEVTRPIWIRPANGSEDDPLSSFGFIDDEESFASPSVLVLIDEDSEREAPDMRSSSEVRFAAGSTLAIVPVTLVLLTRGL